MPVTPGFRDYIVEQLERTAPVTTRAMFGALGVYSDGVFFAIVDDDTLFFKVDDVTRPAYLQAGMPPFMPGGTVQSNNYYQVPVEVLEDPASLGEWMRSAIDVGRASKRPKRRPVHGSAD